MSSTLRKIEIVGPPRRTKDGKLVPFWRLMADSRRFPLKDVKPNNKGLMEDTVHPVRTTHLDPLGQSDWLKPRAMDIHVTAGARQKDDANRPRQLGVQVSATKEEVVAVHPAEDEANLRTEPVADDKYPGFQRLIAAPMLGKDDRWPDHQAGDELGIYVPRMRLLNGALDLRIAKSGFPWLSKLWKAVPGLELDGKEAMRLRLTPEGIEIETDAALPGLSARAGRFLLAPDGNALSLTLLSDRLDDSAGWMSDWLRLTPAQDGEDRLLGLKLEARRGGLPPRFAWPMTWKSAKIQFVDGGVRIPSDDIATRLTGPDAAEHLLQGAAQLKPPHYWIAQPAKATPPATLRPWAEGWGEAGGVILWAETGAVTTPAPEDRLWLEGSAASLTTRLESTTGGAVSHDCAVDDVDLARDLRRAYGLNDPPVGRTDPKQPLLWAFAPLDDGWLQLPAPNTPAPDLSKDDQLLAPPRPAPGTAFSGYLRFQRSDAGSALLSAFGEPPKALDEAPWSVAVESAQTAGVAVRIKTGAAGEPGLLEGMAALLDGPELSTRGLIWLSADRPDGLEALPRMGAGPAAYLDLPLESALGQKPKGLACELRQLEFTLSSGIRGYDLSRQDLGVGVGLAKTVLRDLAAALPNELVSIMSGALTDEAFALDGQLPADPIAWTPPAVAWLRHPRMPLGALMPMTRSVASAARPLESRDLAPFRFSGAASGTLCTLRWAGAAVFPSLGRPDDAKVAPDFQPVASWPALGKGADPRGVGVPFGAFGVPGLELSWTPGAAAAPNPWGSFLAAARYDLPASDEAFATAALPPGMGAAPEPARPVATALHFAQLEALWRDQARRRRLAMVVGSYLFDYVKVGTNQSHKIRDLVGGLTWTAKLGFKEPGPLDPVPYGRFILNGSELAGGAALRGLDAKFKINGGALEPGDKIVVRGYAPASFEDDDGFLLDARRNGASVAKVGDTVWRKVKSAKLPNLVGTATLKDSLPVGAGAEAWFRLWVKDLPIDANGAALLPDETLDFEAWLDDHLPKLGFEWRLLPGQGDPLEALERGMERFWLHGLQFEPLRLQACKLAMTNDAPDGRIESAKILARLHLGPQRRAGEPSENLVVLELGWDDNQQDLEVKSLKGRDGAAMRFVLSAKAGDRRRRVVLEATAAWDVANDRPQLEPASLSVEVFGREVSLPGADVILPTWPNDEVKVTWEAPSAEPGWANNGWVRILQAVLKTTTGPLAAPTLELDRELVVTPIQDGEAAPSAYHGVKVMLKEDKVVQTTLFGLTLKGLETTFRERDGAFAVDQVRDEATLEGAAAAVLQAPGNRLHVAFGWIASVDAPSDVVAGAFELPSGRLDGTLWMGTSSPSRRLDLREITFEATRGLRAPRPTTGVAVTPPVRAPWRGEVNLFGWIRAANAIGWPVLELPPATPPWAGKPGDKNARVSLSQPALPKARLHEATYELNAHRMSFSLVTRLLALDAAAIWTAPAAATHVIRGDTAASDVSWRTVETIALGSPEALIPKWKDHTSGPVTFAARYQNAVVNGTFGADEPGMTNTGEGRLGVVLRGTLGIEFRKMFWDSSSTRSGLYLVGGFVGLLTPGEGQEGEFSRLPVLSALTATEAQDALAKAGSLPQTDWTSPYELAWPDTQAARTVTTSLQRAAAPASSSEPALRGALRAGRWEATPDIDATDAVAAVFVEQSFAPLKTMTMRAPYFLASAVTVQRVITRFPASDPAPTVVSVIAGALTGDKVQDRTLAASVVTRGLRGETAPASDRTGELVTLGDDVVLRPWTSPSDLDKAPASEVAAPAFADHAEPRLAMARVASAKGWRYVVFDLPHHDWSVREASSAKLAFADAHRGYLADVEQDGPLGHPIEEGATAPFVDAVTPPDQAAESLRSGVAGLSRPLALPAWAAAESVRNHWAWYSQHRTPVFEQARFTDLTGPPIPHLSPAAPRARLPVEAAVTRALNTATTSDDPPEVQAIVPAAATVASFADRPGVLMARVSRLESAIRGVTAFDPLYERFGRPGQSGPWTARTERTPRPGPLPPNSGDPLRDRRPCASEVMPRQPLTAVMGPADAVRGEVLIDLSDDPLKPDVQAFAWSAVVVAAEAWRGVVSPVWDGTLRVHIEIDIAEYADPAKAVPLPLARLDVARAVAGLLLGDPVANRSSARAKLAVGEQVITYASAHLETVAPFARFVAAPLGGQPADACLRGRAALVLDLRDVGAPRSSAAASQDIARALADPEAARRVEARLSVRPGTSLSAATPPVAYGLETQDDELPWGEERTPITLRMPLFARQKDRGVLPLAPSSVLFIDPSYDAELGSKPAEHRARLPDNAEIPKGRGDLALVLNADRARANRRGAVTFMADLRFERAAEGKVADALHAAGSVLDGDLHMGGDRKPPAFSLTLQVVRQNGEMRPVGVQASGGEATNPNVDIAKVYELDLARLKEKDGAPAELQAGDLLEITITERYAPEDATDKERFAVWDVNQGSATVPGVKVLTKLDVTRPAVRTLRIILTDEPVSEPPPSLYAAMARRTDEAEETATDTPSPARLFLPLYAQSPLATRVELRSPKADFRAGYMRRMATFAWVFARPMSELNTGRFGVHVVKSERTGQGFWPPANPETVAEVAYFVKPRTLAT